MIYLIIAVLVVFTLLFIFQNSGTQEGFGGFSNIDWFMTRGTSAHDCYSLTPNECSKYNNCGLCQINGEAPKCVPGDAEGPLFNQDCDFWTFTNYDDQGKQRTYRPWSTRYPDFKYWYPSPVTNAA